MELVNKQNGVKVAEKWVTETKESLQGMEEFLWVIYRAVNLYGNTWKVSEV